MRISFNYVSDGPGYAGVVDVELAAEGVTLRLKRGESVVSKTIATQRPLPDLANYSAASKEAIERLWPLLSQEDKDYFWGSPGYVELDRVRLLEFEDGRFGALMLMGEPEFLCVAIYGEGNVPGWVEWLNFEGI